MYTDLPSRPLASGRPVPTAETPTAETPTARAPAAPRVGPPSARTLVDIFAATVAAHPDATALDAPDGPLTYRELQAGSLRLAGRLHAAGINAGDRVVVRLTSGTGELYLAILGVLHAGAAYVPIDVDDPPARAADIEARCGARARIGDGLGIELLAPADAASHVGAGPPRPAPTPPSPQDDAWIIFTSGSTGTPKGVAVTHRAAAAFVDAEAELFLVTRDDRVLAGLSVGFDASCEEMWLAWRNGAALVPAPRDTVRAGEELGDWLLENRVSVVSTVPTLAALWDESCLYQVRLLILGGEACPEPLGWRLAAGREVWNTYGPTEATVVSTAAPILAGAPIRIGRPLAGWEVAVLEDGQPVPPGTPGELVIGGVGLGRYLDPVLDAERFAPAEMLGWDRAYRTGDIVVATADGLDFVGRRDDQVKVGGRRIELGEIEAALGAVPGVRAAAAAVRQSASQNTLLVGYVVGDVDPVAVRASAARRLPTGIVPLVIVLDELPLAPSGKVDRRALPWPVGGDAAGLAMGIGATGEPLNELEGWLAELWVEQLGPVKLHPDSDFFALGGASLAAAKLTSVLRRRFPAVAVADIYHHPTLRSLAVHLDGLGASVPGAAPDPQFRPSHLFAAAQMGGLIVLFSLQACPWLIGLFAFSDLFGAGLPHVGWGGLAAGYLLFASPVGRVLLHAGATRLLMAAVTPGRYRRDSTTAWRLWFLSRLGELVGTDRVAGTPFAPAYARLIGARVGAQARLSSMPETGSMLSVGARATVEGGVDVRGWWVDSGWIEFGPVHIGAGARVATRTMLAPGAHVGAGAEIEAGSVVSGTVPAGEHWGGVPAVRLGPARPAPAEMPAAPSRRRTALLQGLFMVSPLLEQGLMLLAVAPGVLVLWAIGGFLPSTHASWPGMLGEAALDLTLWVPTYALLVALTLRRVWRLVTPGVHPDYGLIGWALWFAEGLREDTLTSLFGLYASTFTAPWLRLMGITVGRGSEISTSTGLNPLVSFGELCQSTDDVGFCGVAARHGTIEVAPISIGDRTFLGPGSVLRGGTTIGPDSLLGVLTLAPLAPPPGSSWLGVPALELPRAPDASDPSRTIAPPRRLRLARGAMDVARLILPELVSVLIAFVELLVVSALAVHAGVLVAVLATPLILLGGGILAAGLTVAAKWTLIGRYRASEHPLWSWFVWRDEFLNATQELLAVERLLGLALGTPLVSLYLRAMGARVGRGVWIETMAVTEFDVLTLEDGAVANRGSCLMTHLFHDRLLRIGPARLEAGATLGPTAATLPDTVLGRGAVVGAHSVVLRGEELPDGSRWQGSPLVAA